MQTIMGSILALEVPQTSYWKMFYDFNFGGTKKSAKIPVTRYVNPTIPMIFPKVDQWFTLAVINPESLFLEQFS